METKNMDENRNDFGPGHEGHHHHCCDGSMCNWGSWGRKYNLLRWVLGLLVLAIVFALGVKVGEFKGFLRSSMGFDYGFPHRGMMQGGRMYMVQPGPGMGGNVFFQSSAPLPESTTTPVTKPKK